MKIQLFLAAIMIAANLWSAPPLVFRNPRSAWKVLTSHKNQISRRSAYIYLTGNPKEREKAWIWALKSTDPVLKRDAIFSYFQFAGEKAAKQMLVMKPDKDQYVHAAIQQILPGIKSTSIRKKLAAKCIIAPQKVHAGQLYRKNIRLKDDPTYDHEVVVAGKIDLAKGDWKFITDPNNQGVKKKYFAPAFNDKAWKKITVNKNWEVQGFKNYNGYAWYRLSFKAPENQKFAGAEFFFPYVDEEAWIWLNGVYLGQRADGSAAWNKPFYMDASKEIIWGKVNQLTVRVFDSDKAGGIGTPPQLHLLK